MSLFTSKLLRLTLRSRRIDIRLLPILGLMYSISLADRTNLGLALVAGMQTDLGLGIGDRYTIIVMVFFVAYILFEIPSVRLFFPPPGLDVRVNKYRISSSPGLVLQTG
jgi:hypothetical protein